MVAWDHMYIVGDATPGGWELNNLTEMAQISESEFEWTGYLGAGQVKFITGNDWGNTQYGADDWDKPLTRNTVFTATQLGDDKKFVLTDETKGWYTLHINTSDMKISTWPRYIYPVGNGCEVGWNTGSDICLTETGFGTGVYTGTLELSANDGHELKFNCARDWSVFVGPEEDWDGAHDIGGVGTYKAKMYTSGDHKFWVLDAGYGTYHVGLDLNNNKLYLVPEQVTFQMHASAEAKEAMENEVSFYWWNAAGGGEWTVSEDDGWYTAIVTNAYMPINYLWHGKDWNSKTGNQENFNQGFVQNQTAIAAYNGNTIDTDKREIELWYESEYSTYGAFTLAASAEHVAPGTEVTFTPAIADYAGTPAYTYYINGVETTLTDGKYTFAGLGFYRVEAITTIDHQIIKASKDIFVENTLTFKVHATNSLKSAWENIYFYSWQNYDGYDHAQAQQLTAEEDGFYTVEIAAVAPVKFLLKNKPQDDWTGLQSVDMNNAEAGYTEGICIEIGSSKNSENKYLVNVLSDCQFTTYELTLGVDHETIKEGETVTFTPAVGSMEGLTYTYYVDDVVTALTDNQLTLSEWGKYLVKVTTEVEGTPLEASKAITVTRDIKISAHINEAAVAMLGGTVNCFAWWSAGSETKAMSKNGSVYEATFAATEPISFLIKNDKWISEVGGMQTVDMKNSDAGYDADRLVHVVEVPKADAENKLSCYHIDAVNTNKITINLYAEDAAWADAYFFTQNVAMESGYLNVFVHPTKAADNWYTYTYEGVNAVDWVARPNSDNWNNQVNDVAGLNGEKYLYIMADKHENNHHKMADMGSKTLPETLTFEFKFDGTAHTSWGNESPVGLYYWQYYSQDCASTADHAAGVVMSKDENDVYTATVKAFNNVKFVVQSDISGYHGSGHYTVSDHAGEESVGFAESKKFWIKDNGSGHYLELTENFDFTPEEQNITLNKDGFASFYWDKNYELVGAEAYVAHISADAVVLTKIDGNGIIPANSGVILYGAPNAAVTATETLDAAIGYDYTNALTGSTTATTPTGNYYVLAEYGEDRQTCFVKISDREIPAYRAYLPEPAGGAPVQLRVRFAPGIATGMLNDNPNDNLHVSKLIRNGHVYIVRGNKVYTVMGGVVSSEE